MFGIVLTNSSATTVDTVMVNSRTGKQYQVALVLQNGELFERRSQGEPVTGLASVYGDGMAMEGTPDTPEARKRWREFWQARSDAALSHLAGDVAFAAMLPNIGQ